MDCGIAKISKWPENNKVPGIQTENFKFAEEEATNRLFNFAGKIPEDFKKIIIIAPPEQ